MSLSEKVTKEDFGFIDFDFPFNEPYSRCVIAVEGLR